MASITDGRDSAKDSPRDVSDAEKNDPSLFQAQTVQNGTTGHVLSNETTHRGFKPRHTQMIALGGTIGTYLFLGTAQTLRTGGPVFLVVTYGLLCVMMYGIVTGIAEIATYLPVPGGTMSFYGHKYVSGSLGFAMGYLYWYSLGMLVPYELVAINLLIDYWNSSVSPAAWITVIMALQVACNFLPVRWYGEAEFWSAGTKVLLILGLTMLSVVLFFGGGPNQDGVLGFRYWTDPGPVKEYILTGASGRFTALCQSFVFACFAFVLAPEQLIVAAGEMQSPRYNLPRAARRYIWRFIILFMPAVGGISVICASNNPALSTSATSSSPFVNCDQGGRNSHP